MIDIHTHILPGIDDGPREQQMMIEMLKMAEADGTKTMIATPHYYYPKYVATQEEVEKKVEMANRVCRENGIQVEVLPGREIMLDQYTLQDIKQGHMGSLAHTQYLLVELSLHDWSRDYLDMMYELQLLGYRLIIAHPERYLYVQEDITMLNSLIKEGAMLQLNADSITGSWGRKIQRTAKELIRQGAAQLIASDAHSTGVRNPGIQAGLQEVEKIDASIARNMRDYPYKILADKDIRSNDVRIQKRSLFDFFYQSS